MYRWLLNFFNTHMVLNLFIAFVYISKWIYEIIKLFKEQGVNIFNNRVLYWRMVFPSQYTIIRPVTSESCHPKSISPLNIICFYVWRKGSCKNFCKILEDFSVAKQKSKSGFSVLCISPPYLANANNKLQFTWPVVC